MRGLLRHRVVPLLRRGHRTVIWSHPAFDLGNYLYLWQAARRRQTDGADCRVRRNDKIEPWLTHFPSIVEDLDLPAGQVRFQDQRDLHNHQRFGIDVTGEGLVDFVQSYVLTNTALRVDEAPSEDMLTLNVRRGDYYSEPEFRGQYSFDVVEYVRTALATTEERDGPVAHVHVVSDGIDWCRDRLGWIADTGRRLTFADRLTPIEAFAAVCAARRLIITNSTFSYWGAYVSNVRHGDNHGLVYAPWFHRRDIDGGASWHLDPSWSVIREIRGGWDA